MGAGNLERATELMREAEELLNRDRAQMPGQQAVVERRLAQLALLRGDVAQAVAIAERAAGRAEDLRYDDNATLQLMLVLAEARSARGDFAAARTAAARAVEMAQAGEILSHSTWAGLAHLQLGVALAGQGETAPARQELQRALDHLRPSLGPEAPPTRKAAAQLQRLGA
jgi:ATP/maltotriose-dependent transcriptional regulator MalT